MSHLLKHSCSIGEFLALKNKQLQLNIGPPQLVGLNAAKIMKKNILIAACLLFVQSYVQADSTADHIDYTDSNLSVEKQLDFGTAEKGFFTQTISNTGSSNAFVKVSLVEAVNGKDVPVEAGEMIVTPTTLIIPPNSKRLVRTIIMPGYENSQYRSFYVSYLPQIPLYEKSEGLKVNISYSEYIGVFSDKAKEIPDLSVTLNNKIAVIRNNAAYETVIRDIKICNSGNKCKPIKKNSYLLIEPNMSTSVDMSGFDDKLNKHGYLKIKSLSANKPVTIDVPLKTK